MADGRIDWSMSPHLEPYRKYIQNTGGNTVEELMDVYFNADQLLFTNLPLGIMSTSVAAQVKLLQKLYEEGHLD